MRVESSQQQSESIWSFRIERYDDAGNRVLLVPVEMRGLSFEGSLSDGDLVRAHGRARGGTFHAREVENLTTGATIQAKTMPIAVKVIVCVFLAAILTFIGWVAVTIFTAPSGFPEAPAPWEEDGQAGDHPHLTDTAARDRRMPDDVVVTFL